MSDIVGIRAQDLGFKSIYVPFLSFANNEQKKATEDYILQKVSHFFKKLHKVDESLKERYPNGVDIKQLCYSKLITKNDFKSIEIGYFYENFLHDLERKHNEKLELPIKWSISFDEECTPIQLAWISPGYTGLREYANYSYSDTKGHSHRKYGTIDINGTPIFYYIYFTLQEILDVIKQLPKSENYI